VKIAVRNVDELNLIAISAADKEQIEKDLPRTFPTNEFFINKHGCQKLYRVLHAYAVIDPDVGYCQGMNFIASVPLFYMQVQEAFDTFVFLMQGLNYRQYFLPGFPRLQRSALILDHLIAQNLPKLHKHLKSEDIHVPQCPFVVQWFLTMFTYNLPFPAIIRMWDWLFVEGHDVLFAVALSILKLVQGIIG